MQTPIQLTFRSMPRSEDLDAHIRLRAVELERLFDRIISCHVIIEMTGRHHRHGDGFRVTINVGLPGHELVVSRDPPEDRGPMDGLSAVNHAFDEAVRQLEGWVKQKRRTRHEGVRDGT
jgi:ribosome-associated translation inhibitor RaiA